MSKTDRYVRSDERKSVARQQPPMLDRRTKRLRTREAQRQEWKREQES